MNNLPIKNLVLKGITAFLPLLVISILSYTVVTNFYLKSKNTSKPEIAINSVKTEKAKEFSFGNGSVLGLSDTPGFIDFCDVNHNVYTVPLSIVPSGNSIRNTTYPSMTKCFMSSWGTPPNYSKGCNIDAKECKGWTWRYICDVNPNVSWAVDVDPNMSEADKMIYFNRHCTKLTGSQTDIGVKFSKMESPSSSSQVYKLDDVECGKLVQVDVTTENCEPNLGQICGHVDDFLIYYTGICATPTPTPTPTTVVPTPTPTPTFTPIVEPSTSTATPTIAPTPTPTPTVAVATIECKSLTGVAKDTNENVVSLSSLPENFVGSLELTCVADATVKPVSYMEFSLNKTLNGNATTVTKSLTGSSIISTSDSNCTSGFLCFKGTMTFEISGQGSYNATSKVCNSDDLCSP